MNRGLWTLLAVVVTMAGVQTVLAQVAAPVVLPVAGAKPVISGAVQFYVKADVGYTVTATGLFGPVLGATDTETRCEVRWRKRDASGWWTETKLCTKGPADNTTGALNGRMEKTNPPDATYEAVEIRVRVYGKNNGAGQIVALTPWSNWRTAEPQ
jgi:hypothetical protein